MHDITLAVTVIRLVGFFIVIVVVFPSSLLKVGDHGTTHQFSPTLPGRLLHATVVHSASVLRSSLLYRRPVVSLAFLPFLCRSIDLAKCVSRDSALQLSHVAELLQFSVPASGYIQILCLRRSLSAQMRYFRQ